MADKPKTMICPFCLSDIPARSVKCSNPGCERTLPRLYTDDFLELPLSIVSAVGFSSHGKTVYLATLLHVLDELSLHWSTYYRQALNESSIELIEANRKLLLRDGILPNSTPKNFPEPSIWRLANIPSLGDRRLLMYDTAGENFHKVNPLIENAGYISHSPVVLFFVSVPLIVQDKIDPKGEIDKLLQFYILGMNELKANTRKQHLVVVYTWGDLMEDNLSEYPDVVKYLNKSELAPGWDMNNYLRQMSSISNQLKQFTYHTLKASNFYNMAHSNFASVEYCIVSSLGRPPSQGRLTIELSPRRVIDPLLWVIQKTGSHQVK